jgi:hypothetical protein
LPFAGLNFLVMGLMIGLPALVLWLLTLTKYGLVPGSRHLGSSSKAGNVRQAVHIPDSSGRLIAGRELPARGG